MAKEKWLKYTGTREADVSRVLVVYSLDAPSLDMRPNSAVFDFAEPAAGDVVDKAADSHGLGNPRMGMELL